MNETLTAYHRLLQKVDDFFARVREAHPQEFQCRLGCHSCCRPALSVGAVEAENIRAGLKNDLPRQEALLALEASDPFQGTRCSFLQANGACGIYELRPVVCRSHGLPIQFKDIGELEGEDAVFRDVCPLNFSGQDLSDLPDESVLNLDTLNTLLAVLNKQIEPSGARLELKASKLARLSD